MAPRKKTEKEEKATGAEGSDMILHYLRASHLTSSNITESHCANAMQAKRTGHTLLLTSQPTCTTKSQKVSQAAVLEIVTDNHTAAAAKLLKDLHEQKLIEGRPAGERVPCVS